MRRDNTFGDYQAEGFHIGEAIVASVWALVFIAMAAASLI